MAVTFAAVSDGDAVDTNFVTSVTISHTPGSGTNRATFVWIHFFGEDNIPNVSSVTQGGNAMTFEVSETSQVGAVESHLYWRVNPDSGAANIVASADAAADGFMVSIETVDNADQTDPVDATATVGGVGGTGTDTIASATGRLVLACVGLYRGANGAVTVGGGQTSRANYLGNEVNFNQALGEEAGAASVASDFGTMESDEGTAPWSMITVSILAAAAGATGTIAATLQPAVASFSGTQEQTGTLTAKTQSPLAVLTGVMQPSGALAAILQSALFNATGHSADNIGDIAAALQTAVFNATGVMHPSGTLAAAVQTLLANLSGTHEQTGTLVASARTAVAALTGVMQPEGDIAASLQPAVFAGTGTHGMVEGTMAAVIQVALFNATGVMHPAGAIAAVLQSPRFSGQGEQPYEGTMAAALQMLLFVSLGESVPRVESAVLEAIRSHGNVFKPRPVAYRGRGNAFRPRSETFRNRGNP